MTLKHLISACLLVTSFSVLMAPAAKGAETIDKVIAQVDQDVILQSELNRKILQAKGQILSRGGQLPPENVLEKELLEQLIIQSLQYQMAARSGMQVQPAELQQIAASVAKQEGMTLDEFRLNMEQQGIAYELFLDDLRKEILTSRFREAFVSRRIKISEKEINSLVKAMDAKSNIEYQLGHILVAVDEDASDSEVASAKEEALGLKQQIEQGAEFEEIAKKHSDASDASKGGDFGWSTEENLPELFRSPVYYMDQGDISRLIRSPAGFHILKLRDKRGDMEHVVQQTKARHILIRPDAITTTKDAKDLLHHIRKEVIAGKSDFGDMAKKYSDDPGSANLGGELGWNNAGVYDPVFEETLSNLEVNEISQPFQTSFGWHIVQLTGKRQDDQTDDMKRQQAAKILRQRKFSEEVENWIREIRDEAYVKKVVEEDA
ncbi:peptidylprolyl isomerase [Kangiella sediminilitoris]|uniref:Chaperone SurA n=1 Tax=Kangiella sediminilitoris TaxID=1144748 RepID=A0A1B3B8J5_9GAMM|nr:peptidylprolyl isomerase [Kangiella sediminilitoris]AOE49117.1 Chaperone SurA [Kangiella sediminilitoris]